MEIFDAEVIKISNEQIFQELRKAPLGVLIQNVANCGCIEDRKLRRLWCTAKRAIDQVEVHLREMVAEQNAKSG